MSEERVQRVGHVPVAKVPRRRAPAIHRAVVSLGVHGEPRVLLGEEGVVLRRPTVAAQRVGRVPPKVGELRDDFVLARLVARRRRRGVAAGIGVEVFEARVARAGATRRGRIDALQVADDRPRSDVVEAVEVEAVEAGFVGRAQDAVVVRAQRADELEHVDVAPHPRREAPEIGERGGGVRIGAFAEHEAVDAPRVGPIRLDRDGAESALLDQPPRDQRAFPIELVRAVRRVADEHEARVAIIVSSGSYSAASPVN